MVIIRPWSEGSCAGVVGGIVAGMAVEVAVGRA